MNTNVAVTIDTTNVDVSVSTGTYEVSAIGITGLKGDTGAAGPANSLTATIATGAAGSSAQVVVSGTPPSQALAFTIPRGDTGATGTDGKTLRNGSGAPSSGLGVDGDFYLDTSASRIYGPKTSGAWGSGVSIIGATGADGKTVRNGATTPSSGLGVDGDFYLNTAANTISGPKASGAWPTAVSLVGPKGDTGANGANGDWSTAQTINAQTGTSYTIASSDAGRLVTLTNSAAVTVTVPTGIATIGQRIDLAQLGDGQVTVSAGSGVTINSTPTAKLRTKWSAATLICTATTATPTATFLLVGDLAAA